MNILTAGIHLKILYFYLDVHSVVDVHWNGFTIGDRKSLYYSNNRHDTSHEVLLENTCEWHYKTIGIILGEVL